MNIASTILDKVSARPQAPCIVEPGGRSLTGAQLGERVHALAWELRRRGMRPGDRVVLQLGNGIELASATLAAIALGAVPVLLEPGLGDEVYLSRIAASGARWLVVHPLLRALGGTPPLRMLAQKGGVNLPPIPTIEHSLALSRRKLDRLVASNEGAVFAVEPRTDDDPVVVVFTGGTTHDPLGVAHTHGSLRAFLGNIGSLLSDRPVANLLADTLPQAMYALGLGRTTWTTRGSGARRARHVHQVIVGGSVDAYFGAPYLWRTMMDQSPGEILPKTLRLVLLGSAPVTSTFLRRLRGFLHPETEVLSIYGLTEAGPVCMATADEKLGWSGGGDFVGRPIPGMSVAIDAEDGGVGEVIVSGDSLFSGYLERAPLEPGEPLRTGDLGRLIDDGSGARLVLMGRTKEMIIRRGVNLYPPLLEPAILALARSRGQELADCAVIGAWNDTLQDEDVVLFVVPDVGIDLTLIRAIASEAVGQDGAPDRVIGVSQLPVRGRQSKRDIQALQAMAGATGPQIERRARLRDAVIPFDFGTFARKYALMLKSEGAPARVLAEATFRLAVWAVSQSTWALDEVVAPGWRRASGLGPLFVLGHQRSGTTFLHRLLAADVTHARALALHEMLVPAVSFQETLAIVDQIDRRLGRPLGERFEALEERAFGSMDSIHKLRLEAVEEDEFTLWAIFASVMVANDAPGSVEHRELDELRHFEQWSQERRERVLGFYRDALARKLYRDHDNSGAPRWIVSKNPAFTQKICDLMSTFEDGRFIYLVRDPLQAIPSRLSMLQEIWRRRMPSFHDITAAQVETMLEDSFRTYLFAERDLALVPADRLLIVKHEVLRADPSGTVRQIYDHFGLPGPDDALEAELARRQTVGAPAKRALTLEDFHLDEARIRRELAPVFERYGF